MSDTSEQTTQGKGGFGPPFYWPEIADALRATRGPTFAGHVARPFNLSHLDLAERHPVRAPRGRAQCGALWAAD